jgi:hypothetical protein
MAGVSVAGVGGGGGGRGAPRGDRRRSEVAATLEPSEDEAADFFDLVSI